MGVDYTVYVGPYIEVKYVKAPTGTELISYKTCSNTSCKRRGFAEYKSKFCSDCGHSIELLSEEVETELSAIEFLNKYDLLSEISADNSEDEEGDTQLFFPINNDLKGGCWSVKHDEIWEDLSDLNAAEEIEKTKAICANSLKIIEEVYGNKPVVKWGVVSNIS
jgi:hypothetical protein